MVRKISEKTLKTALVNLKCLGYFGRCFRPLTIKERQNAVDVMIKRDWLDIYMNITTHGDEIVKSNLDLCQK